MIAFFALTASILLGHYVHELWGKWKVIRRAERLAAGLHGEMINNAAETPQL